MADDRLAQTEYSVAGRRYWDFQKLKKRMIKILKIKSCLPRIQKLTEFNNKNVGSSRSFRKTKIENEHFPNIWTIKHFERLTFFA